MEAVAISAGWGALGAFIYAIQGWLACVLACPPPERGRCHLSLGVALSVGTAAAAAFSGTAIGMVHWADAAAVSALIGLVANPITPLIVKRAADAMDKALAARLGKGSDS